MTEISVGALVRIQRAINDGEGIGSMVYLGLKQRTVNILEDNGIETIEQLVSLTKEEFLSISNFGEKTFLAVREAFSRFDEIDRRTRIIDRWNKRKYLRYRQPCLST